jgi:hypothetical protein
VPPFRIAMESAALVRPYLDEADVLTLLPETLAAKVEAIFANETGRVRADAAVEESSSA